MHSKRGDRESTKQTEKIKLKARTHKNTNTLTDTVIFSIYHFTGSPANKAFNLTVLKSDGSMCYFFKPW